MKESNTTLAMNASNGMFAYHLFGVLESTHQNNLPCPDPQKVALEYLQTFHGDVLEAEEAKENNEKGLTQTLS